MKKVDRVRFLLQQGYSPKEIAQEVPCALSLVYEVRGRQELVLLKHQVSTIREELREIWKLLGRERARSPKRPPEAGAARL